jgi:hypothetical protein
VQALYVKALPCLNGSGTGTDAHNAAGIRWRPLLLQRCRTCNVIAQEKKKNLKSKHFRVSLPDHSSQKLPVRVCTQQQELIDIVLLLKHAKPPTRQR